MANTAQSDGAFNRNVGGVVSSVANNAHHAVDQAASVAGSAVQSVNSAIDQVSTSGHNAVKKVERSVEQAKEWSAQKTEALLAVPKNAVSDARQYIVSNPWQSVAVAVIAGAILGRRSK